MTTFVESVPEKDVPADTQNNSTSVLLQENHNRFVLFPLKYNDIWNFQKKAEASFWTAEELDLLADSKDWLLLNDGERHFIEQTLAFFAASDGIVNENLALNFLSEVQIPEARCFYGFQIAMENIHSEVYSQLIDTYVKDSKRKEELFQGIQTFPSIRQKAEWALHWTSRNVASFGERLVAFACVEGISFSSAFASIFYLKKRGLMIHGLGKSNELIARDEGLHRDFACLLFKYLSDTERPSNERVHQIVDECVKAECQFVEEALPVGLIGMNASSMQTQVKYVADNLLVQLGVPKLQNIATCPFEWMEFISIQSKTNFFESRVTEQAMANVGLSEESRQFSLTEDF